MVYISQGFIIVGYLIFFISRFRKKKEAILMTDTISRICFIAGYCLFGSINSIEHTVYGIVRNIIGQKLIAKEKTYKMFGFVLMIMLLCFMYALSFHGISTIMFILSGLINLFAVIFTKEQGIRLATVLASVCNITAFLLIGSYASIVGEALCGTMGVVSFMRGKGNE